MRRSKVRIKNPLPGSDGITSQNRARRFIGQGKARFTSADEDEIEFIETAQRAAIVKSAEQRLHDHITGVNYDREDQSHFEQAHGLPLIHPDKMIRKQAPSDWAYRAAVWNRRGRPKPEGDR
jgi:hypothetical protein